MTASPISLAVAAVRDARGAKDDEQWAETASFDLIMNDVRDDVAAAALLEVAEQIALTEEPAEELFGDATNWAVERRAEWAVEGVEWEDDPSGSAKGSFFAVLLATAGLSLLFMTQAAISAGWNIEITLAEALFPPLLGTSAVAAHGLFTTLRARRSQIAAVSGTVLLLAGIGVALAAVAFATNEVVLGASTGWWHLAATGVFAMLAFAALHLIPDPHPRQRRSDPADDEAWLDALGAALRARGDITDEHARQIAAEAREHASESGVTLESEFGSPRAYAARFSKNAVVPARRRALFSIALAAVVLGVLLIDLLDGGDFHIWTLAWFGILVFNALVSLASWRKAAHRA